LINEQRNETFQHRQLRRLKRTKFPSKYRRRPRRQGRSLADVDAVDDDSYDDIDDDIAPFDDYMKGEEAEWGRERGGEAVWGREREGEAVTQEDLTDFIDSYATYDEVRKRNRGGGRGGGGMGVRREGERRGGCDSGRLEGLH